MENDGVDLSGGTGIDLSPAAREVDTLSRGRVPAPQIAQAQPLPGEGQGMFGSVRTMRPAIAPANPLDALEQNITADRDRAQKRAANPVIQFFNKGFADKESEKATALDEKLQQVKQAKQAQQDMAAKAATFGFKPGQLPATATNDTLVSEATRLFRDTGNLDMMKGLIAAGHKDVVQTYMPDAVAAISSKVDQAKTAIDRLDAAVSPSPNQKAFNEVRGQLEAEGIKLDSIPKTATEWKAARTKIRQDNQEQKQMVDNFNQQRANWNDFTTEENKEAAEVRQKAFKIGGENMPGMTAVKNLGNGGTGVAGPFGSNDPRMYGEKGAKGWNVFTPEKQEAVQKELEAAYPKAEREKAVSYNRTYKLATTDKDGNPMTEEASAKLFNTNPNIQQAVAEGLAAALRGGAGGANGQLMKLELAKRGAVQTGLDELIGAFAGGKGVITGKEGQYLSKLTQGQVRYVLDFIKGYSDKDAATRLSGVATRVGSYGGRMDQIGLEPELQDAAAPAHAYGRDKAKLEWSSKPRVIRDNDSVFLEGGKAALAVPGAVVTPLPLSALPGLTPGSKSDSGNTSGTASPDKTAPAATTSSPNSGSGGGNPPPLDVQTFAKGIKAGESGGNYAATTPGSSAGGAYQFIKSTWEQFKPAGAPDKPQDASPQQQDAAFLNLTKSNGDTLGKAGVSPTPLNLAIAHQQGAGGAIALAKAPDDAKALDFVDRKAAANNAPFFWDKEGKPLTVAESKAKFASFYRVQSPKDAETAYYQAASQVPNKLANMAPTIGGAAGGIAGSTLGPAGTFGGAVVGGGIGGAVKEYLNPTPGGYDKAVPQGAVEALPMAIPGTGPAAMATRVVTGGATQGGIKYAETGDLDQAIDAGIGGAVGAAVGEGLGKVGSGIFNHVTWNAWNTPTQKAALSAAKTIATEEPKIADAAGKMVNNPKYTDAERFLKSHGKDPEEVAHNYRAAEESKGSINPSTTGQALIARPGAVAEARAKDEYNAIGQSIEQNKGAATNIQGKAALPDGPVSLKQSVDNPNGLPPKFNAQIDAAEIAITGKAKDFAQKYAQLKEARALLLAGERDAIASMAPDKTETAKAMRAIGDTIRTQQIKVINATHPPEQAKVLVARLENADRDYALAMKVSDGNVIKTIAGGGKEGRDVERAFKSLAVNDPDAMNAMRVLVAAEKGGINSIRGFATKGWTAPGMVGAMAFLMHSVPVAGGAIIGTKLAIAAYRYMAARGAGSNVSFATMFANQVRAEQIRRAGSVVGAGAGAQVAQ